MKRLDIIQTFKPITTNSFRGKRRPLEEKEKEEKGLSK